MNSINGISEGLNWSTIPKIIRDEFCKYGNIRSSISTRNASGLMNTTYGDYLHPYKMKFKVDELEYYCIERYYEDLINFLKNGVLFDNEDNQLNIKSIKQYLIEYAKGFQKGYLEYENTLKNTNTIFQNTSEQIAHKVFSRVYGNFTIKSGNFKLTSELDNERANDLKNKHNVKLIISVTTANFFQSGIEGGEFYKAWEIILNNPSIFKTFFDDNIAKPSIPNLKEDMILIDNGIEITIFEKIKRELNTIHWVFKSQLEPKSTKSVLPLIREDGRFCNVIYMRSNIELLKIEEYKNYYYKRFESTTNVELIQSELLQLLEKAIFLLNFYDENLTIKNNLVNEVIQKLKDFSQDSKSFHTAIVLIDNIEPQDILFGHDGNIHSHELEWTNRKYNYASNNDELARFCSKLIEFINRFSLTSKNNQTKKTIEKTNNYFKIIMKPAPTKAENLAKNLISGNYIELKSEKDFINAFIGHKPKNKINWIGNFGDLKTFINHCIKNEYIENENQKWIITSSLFLNKEIEFSEDKIRSTKETKSKDKIKKLVSSSMI
jgi:hypothetical protein